MSELPFKPLKGALERFSYNTFFVHFSFSIGTLQYLPPILP